MAFQTLHQFIFKGGDPRRDSKGAIANVTPCTPGNLRKFMREQATYLTAVKLRVLCECDVIDIQIEAHADGVGRHQKVHIAGLIQFYLRVAGAR